MALTRVAPPDDAEISDELRPLVDRARSGDRAAMRALLVAVAPMVAQAVRRILGRANPEAEDVAQQALAAFVDGLDDFRAESTVRHFAQRIATYRALTARRDAHVRLRHLTPDLPIDELAASSAQAAHEATLDGRDRRELLLQALETLAPAQAEALALHFLFDHTVVEIAGMTGTPEETVRSRLRLGKQSLRARIMSDPRLAALREELA